MSKATVELDFFRIKDRSAAGLRPMEQRCSIRGIQSAISRIDPKILRSVIASGGSPGSAAFMQAAGAPAAADGGLGFLSAPPSPLPVLNPASRYSNESANGTAPLTIFYNGAVAVFDVPKDKAEAIMKLAAEGSTASVPAGGDRVGLRLPAGLLEKFEGDLPIARRKSLQRFLEKRKERLTDSGPYSEWDEGWAVEEAGAGRCSITAPNF